LKDLSPTTVSTEPASAVWRDVNAMTIAYTAKGDNIPGSAPPGTVYGTARVDGVSLLVDYANPGLHPQVCSGSCSNFFDSTTNPNVFVRGTVYTPTASWAVQVQNTGTTIFNRGIVVRSVEIHMSSSSKQTDAPFQLPKGNASGRRVLFKGYVNGESQPRVRACVDYVDTAPSPTGGGTAAFYGYSIAIKRWVALRDALDGDSCNGVP
jgi:hypothetical protein